MELSKKRYKLLRKEYCEFSVVLLNAVLFGNVTYSGEVPHMQSTHMQREWLQGN